MTTSIPSNSVISLEQHFSRIDTNDEVLVSLEASNRLNAFVDIAWPTGDAASIKAFYESVYCLVSLIALPDGTRAADSLTAPQSILLLPQGERGQFELTLRFSYFDDHSVIINSIDWRLP